MTIQPTAEQITRVTAYVQQWTAEAKTLRSKVAERLTDGAIVHPSTIEDLLAALAREQVAAMIAPALASDDPTATEQVAELVLRQALSSHHINSTSNVTVEHDMYTREAWAKLAALVTGVALW